MDQQRRAVVLGPCSTLAFTLTNFAGNLGPNGRCWWCTRPGLRPLCWATRQCAPCLGRGAHVTKPICRLFCQASRRGEGCCTVMAAHAPGRGQHVANMRSPANIIMFLLIAIFFAPFLSQPNFRHLVSTPSKRGAGGGRAREERTSEESNPNHRRRVFFFSSPLLASCPTPRRPNPPAHSPTISQNRPLHYLPARARSQPKKRGPGWLMALGQIGALAGGERGRERGGRKQSTHVYFCPALPRPLTPRGPRPVVPWPPPRDPWQASPDRPRPATGSPGARPPPVHAAAPRL